MNPLLLHADLWDDYALIDSGNGEKLERFGPYFFSRPEPQALWSKKLSPKVWKNVSGKFLTSSSADNDDFTGKWSLDTNLPNKWELKFGNIKFFATPTPFRHLGFFPDQSPHWLWAAKKIKRFIQLPTNNDPPKLLNLFGYSGIASLHSAYNGASVTHVDASKKAINFAFENRNLSSLHHLPIKFITDDAIKFVKREIRRNNKYDAIILDPPKYGRGPNGEKWELFNDLPLLLKLIPQILSTNPIFIILNSYAIRSSYLSLHYALKDVMQSFHGQVQSGELSIKEEQSNPRQISTAIFARWESS
ncbi:class I SAM-dependent methyltransferase [Alphaproteobacteria bacterium]|nr:class I SAM-dependent methyltransferase [Alphaproteobacteria bacterium]MDC1085836.1 class I SAM-dependent methyltransferase [Alphaproteobacteria bacterium]